MKQDSPHFWWIISVLAITIMALLAFILTFKVMRADKIMEYISYASVILSITLSIFAILYTYTSNVQIQQQFDKINTAANNIISTSGQLTTVCSELKDNLHKILGRLDSIDQLQKNMTNQLGNINDNIGNNTVTNQLPSN